MVNANTPRNTISFNLIMNQNMPLSDLVTEIFRYTLSVVYLKTLKYDFEAKPL